MILIGGVKTDKFYTVTGFQYIRWSSRCLADFFKLCDAVTVKPPVMRYTTTSLLPPREMAVEKMHSIIAVLQLTRGKGDSINAYAPLPRWQWGVCVCT